MRAVVVTLVSISLWAAVGVTAQEEPSDRATAERHLAEGRPAEALALFATVVEDRPEDARAWLGLAKARHEVGEHAAALEAMERAAALGAPTPSVAFHSARIHAATGNLEAARASLEALADTGVKVWSQLQATPELAALTSEPSFQAVLARIRPCGTDAYRAFDFWVGDWVVLPSSGGPPGKNTIRAVQEGCLIQETYENGPYSGTSMSFHDEADGRWHQVWVDNQGLILRLAGGWDGERMVLSSAGSRITWTPRPDGTVRQVWEQSSDGGETWTVVFDGTYEPRRMAAGDDGAEMTKLTRPRFSYPTWTPDGGQILYESAVTGNWEIWMMDREGLQDAGGDLQRLTSNQHLDRTPSLSPDGRSIVFISDRDGDYEVFRMNRDGTDPVQLTFNELPEIHPYWSPDGSAIIYNRRVEGERLYEIRMMDADGSNDRTILRDEELNSYAQISPDGTHVVFDKWQDNQETNGEIYLLSLLDGRLTRLTDNAVYDGYPTWFPDGRILFSSLVDDQFKLFVMDADGTGLRQLTFGEGSDARAGVSANGAEIVFNREIDDNINIHVMSVSNSAAE